MLSGSGKSLRGRSPNVTDKGISLRRAAERQGCALGGLAPGLRSARTDGGESGFPRTPAPGAVNMAIDSLYT